MWSKTFSVLWSLINLIKCQWLQFVLVCKIWRKGFDFSKKKGINTQEIDPFGASWKNGLMWEGQAHSPDVLLLASTSFYSHTVPKCSLRSWQFWGNICTRVGDKTENMQCALFHLLSAAFSPLMPALTTASKPHFEWIISSVSTFRITDQKRNNHCKMLFSQVSACD